MNRLLLFLFLLLTNFASKAQDAAQPAMADNFRAEGKIYVVVAVMGIIFAAILLLLVVIERKVKKLENELKNKK